MWKLPPHGQPTNVLYCDCAKNTIHQVTTMLATSKNVLFPGHNYLLTTGTHWRPGNIQSEGSSVSVVSRRLWPGTRTYFEVASMVVTWWIVTFSTVLCPILWVSCSIHYCSDGANSANSDRQLQQTRRLTSSVKSFRLSDNYIGQLTHVDRSAKLMTEREHLIYLTIMVGD